MLQLWRPQRLKPTNLLKQIKAGASFDEIAKKNSAGPSAAQGGDLGVFKRGTLAKELEDKTFRHEGGCKSPTSSGRSKVM